MSNVIRKVGFDFAMQNIRSESESESESESFIDKLRHTVLAI